MKRFKTINVITVILLLCAIGLTYHAYKRVAEETSSPVYVVPLRGTISGGTADFIRRAIRDAEKHQARSILVELSTFGGDSDAMKEIGEILDKTVIPLYTFVDGKAISAGAYIAMAGEKVAMTPASVMGASQPRKVISGEPLPEKELSAFRKLFRAQAESRARKTGVELNPLIAEAMVDQEIAIPDVTLKGKLLTLTAKRAVELKYADFIAENRNDVLMQLELADARIVQVHQTPVEGLVRILTDPFFSLFLLTIGFTALIIEVFTVGFGIAGTIGITSILLFFGARILSGLAGIEVIFLFILGIVLLAVEIFVTPGFGVSGALGLASVGASVVLSYSNSSQAWLSLGLSTIWTLVFVAGSMQFLQRSGVFRRLTLQTAQSREEGYTAVPVYQDYVGQEGVVLNTLRPAGTGEFAGERLDIVSEGEYLTPGTRVRIIRVEGRRIVVRSID
jgi:membrane-bound serine protease (ClpP class)